MMDALSKRSLFQPPRQRKYFLYWRKRAVRRKDYTEQRARSSKNILANRLKAIFDRISNLFVQTTPKTDVDVTDQDEDEDEDEGDQAIGETKRTWYSFSTDLDSLDVTSHPRTVTSLVEPMFIFCVLSIHEALDPDTIEKLYFNQVSVMLCLRLVKDAISLWFPSVKIG